MNPVENIRRHLRAIQLSNRVFETDDAIIDAAREAWNWLIDQPGTIASIGLRDGAHIDRSQGPVVLPGSLARSQATVKELI